MNRRIFNKKTAMGLAMAGLSPYMSSFGQSLGNVRLGGPVYQNYNSPEQWVAALKSKNYRAAYCPVSLDAGSDEIRLFEAAAKKADIVIAEVGAWSNPISPDAEMARTSFDKCTQSLQLADAIGANCCVNISGSKNPEHWAGPHKDNLSSETFDQVVEVTRKIIDEVQPKRTHFALEPMPWAFPDSADSYLDLIRAIDRKAFGVHMDPMNLIITPSLYYGNAGMIKSCFKKLGPHIRSCHAKDIQIREDYYMPQFTEVRPGLGVMDYQVFLQELSQLSGIPLMMEHLSSAEEYDLAARYIRSEGQKIGITV